jgi:hypothetical protein
MGWWLRSLSITFVVSSVAYGAIFLLKGEQGERLAAEAVRLRPAFDDMVAQGSSALRTLLETSTTKQDAPSKPVELAEVNETVTPLPAEPSAEKPGQQQPQGQLPFVVIEPKDVGAPAMAQAKAPAVKTPEVSDLRLRQGLDQEPMDLSPVEARLRMRVPQEVMKHFDLFLYVSKATPDKGSWAQTMFVLARTEANIYELRHAWKVSTGKEEMVMSPAGRMLGTNTPEGMFKLDRWRSFEDYTSRQWQSPMPYAIFFDWQIQGRVSGLALHGSDAKGEMELGNRASHGCIRMATDNARTLFQLITQNYKGRVPKFQIDPETGTMSTKGTLQRDENGKLVMTSGYKVLVFIEDYGGPANDQIAALF